MSAREQQILSTGQALTVRGANISFCQEPRYLWCPVTRPSRGHLSGSCRLLCGGGVVGRFSPRPGLVVVDVVLTVGRVWSACCCCTCWARRLGPGIRPPGEDLSFWLESVLCRAQELCERPCGHPGLPVPNSPPYGLCGRKATLCQEKEESVLSKHALV